MKNDAYRDNLYILRIFIIVGIIVGIFLIVIGFLILFSNDFNNMLIKFISFLRNKSPSFLINGVPVYKLWLIKLPLLGKFGIITGILTFMFHLVVLFFYRKNNEKLSYSKFSKLITGESNFFSLSLFVIGISIAVIFLIITLGLISWPVYDDFILYAQAKSSSLLGFAWNLYNHWDGRFFAFFLLSILFRVTNLQHSYLTTIFYACCLILTAYVLVFFLKQISSSKKLIYYDFAMMLSVLWLGLFPILKEVVYWATGGYYIITSLFAILWILIIYVILFKIKVIRYKYISIPLFMIFAFLMGSSGQILSPALIFITIVMLIIAAKRQKVNKSIIIAALIFLIFGTIFMFTAPGNFIRAEYGKNSFNFSVITIFKNYIKVFLKFSQIAIIIIVLAILGAFSSAIIKAKNNPFKNITTASYIKNNKERLIIIISFLAAALITIIPFMLVPDFDAARASIYYLIFLLLFIWGIVDYFSVLLINRFYKTFFHKAVSLTMIPIICFTFMSYTIVALSLKNIYFGTFIRQQMNERNEYLSNLSEEGKKEDIAIKPIQGKVPELFYFVDMTTDKEYEINQAVADYYKLKSIRVDDYK